MRTSLRSKACAFRRCRCRTPSRQVLWGFHESHLLVAIGRPVAEQMVAGLKQGRGPPPWLAQLRRELPVERVASVSYYDLAKARGLLTHFAGPRSERIARLAGPGQRAIRSPR